MSDFIPFKMNRWQLLASINYSNRNRIIAGRGTGKTTYMGYTMKEVVRTMPGSANALVCATYIQAFTRTLPAIVAGLSMHGIHEGANYIIGKEPPKSWGRPIFPVVQNWKHTISFPNGAMYHIVSQERKGSSRGFNIDSFMADEGLNLSRERIENEVMIANRANANGPFANSRYHLSEMIVSSMPFLPEAMWLLDAADYYKEYGWSYQDYRIALSSILLEIVDSDSVDKIEMLWKQAYKLKQEWKFFKHTDIIPVSGEKLTTYFCDADIFDNIQNLPGWRYVKQLRASMSDLMFQIEILNSIMVMMEQGFYPALGDHHFYKIDTDLYNIEIGQEVTAIDEPSINPSLPIHSAGDFGGSFNCLHLSQEYDDEERLVNSLKVYHPDLFRDVVNKAVKYLATHRTKVIHFWYDQTAIGKGGLVEWNYADDFQSGFTKAGWKVIMHYMGAAPNHHVKFVFMNAILGEKDPQLPRFRMHPDNCRETHNSMRMAPIRQGRNGFEKDKSAERNKHIDQALAPHLSDGVDVLLYHKYSNRLGGNIGGFSAGVL